MAKLPSSLKDPLPRAVFDNSKRGSRYNRMLPEVKRSRFPELYRFIDPDDLTQVTSLPPGMREQAEDIFGDWIRWERDGAVRPPDPTKFGWLKLRIHPWYKRWVMFEWCPEHTDGGQVGWWPTFVFQEEPIVGVVPQDLDDPKFDNLRGKLGAFKVPTKEDFESFYLAANRSLYKTSVAQLNAIEAPELKRKMEKEQQMRDYEQDLSEYHSDERCREANRFFGGMQGLPFVNQKGWLSDEERAQIREVANWTVEVKELPNGGTYKVRTRRTPTFLIADVEAILQRMKAERAAAPVETTLIPEAIVEAEKLFEERVEARPTILAPRELVLVE
jgi:hypothetical protein